MPLPVLDGDKGTAAKSTATVDGARDSPPFDAPPFPLPELELGSMKVTKGKRKGIAVLDDDDPREEAQVSWLILISYMLGLGYFGSRPDSDTRMLYLHALVRRRQKEPSSRSDECQ